MRVAVLPSQRNIRDDFLHLPARIFATSLFNFAELLPIRTADPFVVVMGRSVFLRKVKQGIPNTVVSVCKLPESVITIREFEIR